MFPGLAMDESPESAYRFAVKIRQDAGANERENISRKIVPSRAT